MLSYQSKMEQIIYIKDKILDFIYSPATNYYRFQLNNILNSVKTSANQDSILYKGKVYNIGPHLTSSPIKLPESKYEEMEEFLKYYNIFKREYDTIHSFIGLVLSTINNFEDLQKILGVTICNNLKKYSYIFNGDSSSSAVKNVLQVYPKEIQTIHHRLLDNVLMGDIYASSKD